MNIDFEHDLNRGFLEFYEPEIDGEAVYQVAIKNNTLKEDLVSQCIKK